MKASLTATRHLLPQTEKQLYRLFCRQFTNIPMEAFRDDLHGKDWALLLREDDGRIVGFTCWQIYPFRHGGKDLSIVYSGDTVIEPEVWIQSALSTYWLAAIWHLMDAQKIENLYWFLIVSGYRTYRFLPLYAQEFYPCHNAETPTGMRELMAALASERFGKLFDVETGIIRLDDAPVQKGEFKGISLNRMSDPHIRFFAEVNPGHEAGDELVCITELSEDNMTPAGRKMWKKGKRLLSEMEIEL